jgi:hypothetical protein
VKPLQSLFATSLLIGGVVWLAGCASDQQARKLAVDVAQDIVAYENAIDAKINAENTFYRDQLATLRTDLGGNSAITIGTNAATAITNLESAVRIRKSLPYGRIMNRAEHDARIAAESIITSDDPQVMTALMEYLEDGLNHEQNDYLDVLARQRELANSFKNSLAKIDEQKQKLAAVRKSLALLAATPSATSRFEELISFGIGVRNELNNTNAGAMTNPAPTAASSKTKK